MDAARAVLEARLTAVEQLVGAVGQAKKPTAAEVHRLRVATRRADAALRAFGPLLRRKRVRRLRKLLRRYRSGAAAARMADVQAGILRRLGPDDVDGQARIVEATEAHLRKQAAAARRSFAAVVAERPAKRLAKARRHVLRGLAQSSPAFEDLAQEVLPKLVRGIAVAGGGDLACFDGLHALRLSGKRLRYALEIFSPCLGPHADEVVDRIRAMQDELGAINDDHEIAATVERWAARHGCAEEAAPLVARWRRRRDERSAAFVRAWDGAAALLGGLPESLLPAAPMRNGSVAVEVKP